MTPLAFQPIKELRNIRHVVRTRVEGLCRNVLFEAILFNHVKSLFSGKCASRVVKPTFPVKRQYYCIHCLRAFT